MRAAVTGTPGVGKTTAVERLVDPDREPAFPADAGLDRSATVELSALVDREGLTTGHDDRRDSAVVDLPAVRSELAGREPLLVESHLAHRLDVDRVVVLRCHPEELADRLRDRGYDDRKVEENARSEALDVVLGEAVDRHGAGAVAEVDTTGRSPRAVAGDVADALRDPDPVPVGRVSFVEYLDVPGEGVGVPGEEGVDVPGDGGDAAEDR